MFIEIHWQQLKKKYLQWANRLNLVIALLSVGSISPNNQLKKDWPLSCFIPRTTRGRKTGKKCKKSRTEHSTFLLLNLQSFST